MENDLIDRQAAIDAIVAWAKDHNEMPDGDDCIMIIGELPSAQPETQWIPCGERLPEEREMVLICKRQTDHHFVWTKEWEQIDIAWRERDGRSGKTRWQTHHFEWIQDGEVIAWMPLPEPFREDDIDYEHAVDQLEHDIRWESTFNTDAGSM